MQFTKNGIVIGIPDAVVIDLAIRSLRDESVVLESIKAGPPKIGEIWIGQDGIYAGLIRGVDGEPDCHLIVGVELDGASPWDLACAWATELRTDGFADWSLPTRKEQALLFANVADEFKTEYYWSREQHAGYSDYAWGQDFNDGYQSYWREDVKLRARAVRRFPIF
jgi:hypothetical protein